MNNEKYLSDLQDIKKIMNRTSRFISLSGLSGIFAGTFALLGAYAAYNRVYAHQTEIGYRIVEISSNTIFDLLTIAFITIVCAVISGLFFTIKESKKRNQEVWDEQVKRLLVSLLIPLITGGLLCLLLLFHGHVGIIAPLTLVFYGLALINASHYTLGEIKSLGLIQVFLGLLAAYYIGFGLLFWAIGFGIFHILYGIIMHYRYNQ